MGGLISLVKTFWPLLFTIALPRGITYYRQLKTAYRTRPPPRPVPKKASVALNILFCSVVFFLVQSVPRGKDRDLWNVFATTNTRLGVTLDILFSRLAILRPGGILTELDEKLKGLLLTKDLRLLYLRYGPSTVLKCPFCRPEDQVSYALYHVPSAILLPHLLHITVIGIATSSTFVGLIPSKLRSKAILASLALLILDLYLSLLYIPNSINNATLLTNKRSPTSTFATMKTIRPLMFCLLDAALSLLIWTSATGRFLLFPFLSNPELERDPAALAEQVQQTIGLSTTNIATGGAKLRAFNIVRNAVVRDQNLKDTDDGYWRRAVNLEGIAGSAQSNVPNDALLLEDEAIWEDEEVQAALARAYGAGTIDVARVKREARSFVGNVTKDLEQSEQE